MQVLNTNNYVTVDGTIHHNSGKSSGCVIEIIRRAHEQVPGPDGIRRSRWAVVRNSYGQLKDTTIKTFHDWFPPKMFGEWRVTDHTYIFTKFPGVQLEILFRALDRPDQVSNLLSLEVTGAWFNEVREIPKTIIEAMDSRIGRYPSLRDGGASWYGIIMDTNPPDEDSYLYKMFEKVRPDNWEIFKQPSGLSVHAENIPHLPKNYYKNLAKGKDEMYIRIYIHGQYGYLISGKPVFMSFRDNIHVAPAPLEPMKGLDVLIGFDFGLCYDDQTEVLTKVGWKYFKDVSGDDTVMTKNFDTNIIEYQKPSHRIVRDYTGDMYLYENNNINFCVTPEHIIPCRRRFGHDGTIWKGHHRMSAKWLYDNIQKHYAVDLRAEWKGDSSGTFGPLGWSAHVFSEFMGLYLSEGSCDKVHSRIHIAQNNCDPVFQEILDATGLTWKRNEKMWRVTNELLNNYLRQFGYAKEKYVPDEIKNMATEDIISFIFSYTRGDGHIRVRDNGAEEHTIFTTSRRMAGDFQELAQKVYWYAKIREVKPQDSVIFENGKGRVIHNEGGYCITFKKRAMKSALTKQYFSKVQYSGKVYCLTVPNGTLYVRRKWNPSWNGNSPACVIGQISPLGQLRILDELVSDGMGLRQFCENQLLPLLRQKYFGMNVMGYGDPSGSSRAPTDETTCFDILKSAEIGLGNINPAPTNAIIPRVGAVEKYLNKMSYGEPGFILSPNCHFIRKAMNGAYHYDKDPKGIGDEYKPMPVKNFASHICFVGETMILTSTGEKRIDEIATGDRVITPYGERKVLASGCTQRDAAIMEISLSDGTKIKCTGNHRFILANKSIAKCNALKYNDVLQDYHSWRTLKWSIQSLLSSKAGNIGFQQGITTGQKIGEKEYVTYTALSGNIVTAVRCLMDMMCTTLTTIRSIMTYPTLNLSTGQTMPDTISKKGLQMELSTTSHRWCLPEKRQDHGTHLQKVLTGTESTEKKHGKTGSYLQLPVTFAGLPFKHPSRLGKHFAARIAGIKRDIIAGLITLKERASFVVQTLRRIKIVKLRHVPRIVRISPCLETENVYNITVETDHVYYANGMLACNCDALQMLCLFLDEKEVYDKQRKSFLAQMKPKEYRPASSMAGY